MNRNFKKFLCTFLSALMIIQVLPMAVWGAEVQNKTLPKIINTDENTINITQELPSESNSHEKTYLADDGSKISICELSNSSENSQISTYSLNNSEDTNGIATLKLYQTNTPETGDFILGNSKKNYAVLEFDLEKLSNSFIPNAYISIECKKINNKSNNTLIAAPLKATWNPGKNPSFNAANKSDYLKLDASFTGSIITLDITKFLNSCITGGTNYGLLLYNSTDVLDEFSNLNVYINHRNITEVDQNIESEIVDMGRAGTVYINDFNGAPTIVRNEIGLNGSLAPVQIQSILNPYNETSNFTGSNFRTNYESTIKFDNDTFVWNMCTGEKAYLTYKSNSISYKTYTGTDSLGKELTLKWYPTNNKYDAENLEGVKITDSDNYEYHFNPNGFLTEILTNSNDNSKIVIKYLENNDITRFSTITDGAGRVYKFEYNDNNQISKISLNKLEGNEYIPLQINENNIVIEYSYNNGLLSQVKYPDNTEQVKYEDDTFDRISNVSSNNGNTLNFTYTKNNDLSMINNFTVKDSNERAIQNITINYDETYRRTFTNQLENESSTQKTKILDFNKSYNLIYLEDFDNKNYFLNYQNNKLNTVLNNYSSNNLVQYSTFDYEYGKYPESSDYSDYWEDIGYGEITVDTNTSRRLRSSDDCLRIGNTPNDATGVYQTIEGEFKAGEQYVLEAYAMASNAVPIKNERLFSILVSSSSTNDDGIPVRSETIAQMDYQPYIKNWQLQKQVITIPENTDQLYLYLCYANMEGYCYFDSVKLYKYSEKDSTTAVDRTTYDYDNYGRLFTETVTERNLIGTVKSQKEKTYTYNGNNLTSVTDNGITTYYNYDSNNSLLTSYGSSPNSDYNTKFSYNGIGALESVQQIVNQIDNETTQGIKNMSINTSYSYEHDNVSKITHNGFTYNLSYDALGNISDVTINDDTSIFSFDSKYKNKNQLSKITYGDGTSLIYQKSIDDDYYNIVDIYEAKQENPDINKLEYKYEFKYDYDGTLVEYIDKENDTTSIWFNNEHIVYNCVLDTFLNKINNLFRGAIELSDITEIPIYRCSVNFNGTIFGQSLSQTNVDIFGENYSVISSLTNSKTQNTTTKTDRIFYGEASSLTDIKTSDELRNILNNSNYTVAKTTTDGFGRTTYSSITSLIDGTGVVNKCSYKDLGSKKTTNLLSEYETFYGGISTTNPEATESAALLYKNYEYQYNSKGQITDVYLTDKNLFDNTTLEDQNTEVKSKKIYHYKYDELGQLVVEVNLKTNIAIVYYYDAGGNLTERRYYEGDSGFNFDPVSNELTLNECSLEVKSEYDPLWKDLMTSIGENEITYDNAGNPLNYVGINMFGSNVTGELGWSGKNLTSFKDTENNLYFEYKYNADGLRTQKKLYTIDSNGKYQPTSVIDYIWDNDIIAGYRMGQYDDNGNVKSFISVKPVYDDNKSLMGLVYEIPGDTPNDSRTITIPVLKDGLGNITDMYTSVEDTELMFHYDYDAYGNCLLNFSSPEFNETGNKFLDFILIIIYAIVLAALLTGMVVLTQQNYRGYLYDAETGLYYNQTRYYSPAWCRFINCDDVNVLTKDSGEVLGANLFKYCDNDPINYSDPSGFSKLSNLYDDSLLSLMGITPTDATKLNISKTSTLNTIDNKLIESSLSLTPQQKDIWNEVFDNNAQTVHKGNGYNYLTSHVESVGNDKSKMFNAKSKTPYNTKTTNNN